MPMLFLFGAFWGSLSFSRGTPPGAIGASRWWKSAIMTGEKQDYSLCIPGSDTTKREKRENTRVMTFIAVFFLINSGRVNRRSE